jgi:superfamily I DNA/RNA helicase
LAAANARGLTRTSLPSVELPLLEQSHDDHAYLHYNYAQWTARNSPLTEAQRTIVESDLLDHQPLRIMGAAGTGKTLVMMLLAIRRLERAREEGDELRILYLTHNLSMRDTVSARFISLGAGEYLSPDAAQRLLVDTLFGYATDELQIESQHLFDRDAYSSKNFQLDFVGEALKEVLRTRASELASSSLFSQAASDTEVFHALRAAIADEISVAIKGQGLRQDDRKKYVESERHLSRLHGACSLADRDFVFETFNLYHSMVFGEMQILDSDDVAISLLGRLSTPVWDMRRRQMGFHHVFVDETQLFNENERRVFMSLVIGNTMHVPLVLALDQAQQTRASASAGLGRLGVHSVADRRLTGVHRCTKEILALAFFVVQRTTDLFGPDFPDFTGGTTSVLPSSHPLATRPTVHRSGAPLGVSTGTLVADMRRANVRRVAVVVHAERYFAEVHAGLRASAVPFVLLEQRGQSIPTIEPVVVLSRPDSIGGQEFDAVVCVGLEHDVVPARIEGSVALSQGLEQQALREIYVAFTRARYQVHVVLSPGAQASRILEDAIVKELLVRPPT